MRKINKDTKSTVSNTFMLYILAVIKLILPLVTLPYLTRVLSEEAYGTVSYVKSCMTYMQLIIDFGFMFSAVKDIVKVKDSKEQTGLVAGHTYLAKTMLIGVSFIAMLIMCFTVPILRGNIAFTLLYFISVATTAYVADFLFRGIEKMHIITIIFVITKAISTILTFIIVKNDSDLLWMPVLDIIAHLVSIIIGQIWVSRLGIKVRINNIRIAFAMIKDSFTYFISSMATTVFSVLSTFLIGIVITDLKQIAYWGVCIQIIGTIQGLYHPITNGIYPHMIRKPSLKFIHKIMLLIMPVVTVGCLICFFFSDFALLVIGGKDYVVASPVFRWLIPVLFFSFPAQLYGWPTLGAVGMAKQTTITTVIAAVVQIVGLVILIAGGFMTLISIAILKWIVEAVFMICRMFFVYSNRDKFDILPKEAIDNTED